MGILNLDHLLKPASIVIVDTHEQAPRVGAVLCRNLRQAGFQGEITAVLPNGAILEEIPTVRSVSSLPQKTELAVISAALESLPALIGKIGNQGIKAAVIIGDEYDTNNQQLLHQCHADMLEAARPHGLRILGPGSFGIVVPRTRINASIVDIQPRSGNLALVGQSGAALLPILEWAASHDLGFSHVISLGRMVDVDYGDVIDYLANDADTRAILLLIESLTQVRKFLSAARAITRRLPVVALKTGRFQPASWSSGSPMMPGITTSGLYDAVFRRCGIVAVSQLRELLEAAQMFTTIPSLAGDRLAILANGQDLGWLAADALSKQGSYLAELSSESIQDLTGLMACGWSPDLPMDLGLDADGNRYAKVLEILMADPGVDAILALHTVNALSSSRETAEAVIETLRKGTAKLPAPVLIAAWMGDDSAAEARQLFAKCRIPCYETPEAAVHGVMQPVRFRRLQDQLTQTVPSLPDDLVPDTEKAQSIISRALAEGRTWLTGPEAKDVLVAYGVPIVPTYVAATPEEAAEIAKKVDAGHELMIAVVEEARLGPVVLFGQGGTAFDAVQDLAPALPPLDLIGARELMERTRIYRLLEGTPAVPAADLGSIALTLVKISQLICDLDAVVEVHINPLLALSQGVVAVDAWMKIDGTALPAAKRLAIRPYPKELEQTLKLPDGQALLLRPIRPEDEPLYVELFESLSPEEVFFRFLNRMKTLSHNLAARLTQLDYDRDMALVLVGKRASGETVLFGGSRIMADPDNERAEFAVLLRGDMTGLGLGPTMLRRIIDYARSRGIAEIYGEVLSDNRPMLKLCQVFGFTAKRSLDDPGIVNVCLKLREGRN